MNTFKNTFYVLNDNPQKFLQTSTLIQNLIPLTPSMFNKASSFYQLVQPKEPVRQSHESDRR